jgi:hypothetical protein
LRYKGAVLACVACLALILTAAASQAPPTTGALQGPVVHRETPDDPPASQAARDDPEARSPGLRVSYGPYVSIQVNVDALGRNIVGDAANEPSLAVSPARPGGVVVGWRQFDHVSSNFRKAGWAYSVDGGHTWTFPGTLQAVFRSDPVLGADRNGNFYYHSLTSNNLVDLFKSTDSGKSWRSPVPAFGGDKNWMAVDRTDGIGGGHVYGIWQRFFNCCGDRTFTRSADEGASFEEPVHAVNNPTFGTLAVGPDGEVYAAGIRAITTQEFDTFVVAKSTTARDPAQTPTFSGRVVDMGGSMTFTGAPNPGGLLGQAVVAVDQSNGASRGHVYMVASVDPPGSDPLDVHIVRSTDGGSTWSAPVRVNDDPTGNGAFQWFGTLSVSPLGRIDAVWNDTRASGQSTVSQLAYACSHDGGQTWSRNVAVSPPFNSTIGWPNQNKIGDYYDMVSDEAGASVVYAATFNGEQDVYFVRVFPDCNGSGIADYGDIANGSSRDSNKDWIPDECQVGTGGRD